MPTHVHIYIYIYIYIYVCVCVCVCVCVYQVNKECEYPKNECSMHGHLIQNIPLKQNIYFCLKNKKFRNSFPFP